MAGRKQHFIPQMLLRSFGSPSGKSTQVQVCRHGKQTFIAATDGVAAEREFYSQLSAEGEQKTLDDHITDYEGAFSDKLRSLQALPHGAGADPLIAAEFATHLVTRNDHFRRSITAAAESLFEALIQGFSNETMARRLLGVSAENPGRQLLEAIDEAVEKRPELQVATGLSKAELRTWALRKLEKDFSDFHDQMDELTLNTFSKLTSDLPRIAGEAQRNALEKELIPNLRVTSLAKFHWTVLHSSTELILPDCVAIARTREGKRIPLILSGDEDTQSIFLPISKSRLLLAECTPYRSKVDLKYLNKHLARCAWDFFVASVDISLSGLSSQTRKATLAWIEEMVSSTLARND